MKLTYITKYLRACSHHFPDCNSTKLLSLTLGKKFASPENNLHPVYIHICDCPSKNQPSSHFQICHFSALSVLLGKAYTLQAYRISRTNIILSFLKMSALCGILIRFYGPLTRQNRRCEPGWFLLGQSHICLCHLQ